MNPETVENINKLTEDRLNGIATATILLLSDPRKYDIQDHLGLISASHKFALKNFIYNLIV